MFSIRFEPSTPEACVPKLSLTSGRIVIRLWAEINLARFRNYKME
jgi:hypothetical protein